MDITTKKQEKWWQQAVFYQIYMPSFCDGNGDGIGDFKGITSKLEYLKELGIACIWLTPFYKSPKVDNGYDIEDYYAIDKDYGTMQDFDDFIKKAHELGIRVIADIVLNHTSDRHVWFEESRSSLDNPKRDWYIWKESTTGELPNNWESFFGEKAWTLDEATGEYYYHAFAKEQVDLNWANKEMRKAIFEILAFWMDKGVDGFRLDVINFLTVKDDLRDNPYNEKGEQIHKYDVNQEGIFEIIQELRNFTDQYEDKFLVGEIGSEVLSEIHAYVGEDKLHTTFNFNLGSKKTLEVKDFYKEVEAMNTLYKNDLPTLFFGSHDMSRFPSRFELSDDEVKLIATFMLTFRGIPFIYFGDEIGMRDFSYENKGMAKDIQGVIAYNKCIEEGKSEEEAMAALNRAGRDKSRNAMQWRNKEDKTCNVERQQVEKNSIFNYYKSLIRLRKEHKALCLGKCSALDIKDNVIYYTREYVDEKVAIIINLGDKRVALKEIGICSNGIVKVSNKDVYECITEYVEAKQALICLVDATYSAIQFI